MRRRFDRSMAEGDVHTLYYLGVGWVNIVIGMGAAGRPFRHKHDAVKRGCRIAAERRSEHRIHDLDGNVEERVSYGRRARPRQPPTPIAS
jgi:hypothetical protein